MALEAGAPKNSWVQVSLAQTFYRQRDLTLALHHAQRAAELDPSQPGIHFLVAELFDDLDRHAAMIPPLRTVLDLQPEGAGTGPGGSQLPPAGSGTAALRSPGGASLPAS